MTNNSKVNWAKHFEDTKNHPPSPLLIEAVDYVNNKNKAIDIGGGGTLKDSLYLLNLGFETTIIDHEEVVAKAVEKVGSDKLHCFVTDFIDFNFPIEEYDLASAMFSLPFILPENFEEVFANIKSSLVQDGIFCGQFFGNRDEWNNNPNNTFYLREDALSLLNDMEIIKFEEKEFDGKTADKTQKHWHFFNIIARKVKPLH